MIRAFAALSTLAVLTQLASAQTTLPANTRNLGPEINSTLVQGATFAADSSGNVVVCTVMSGTPGKLLVLDAETGGVLQRIVRWGARRMERLHCER